MPFMRAKSSSKKATGKAQAKRGPIKKRAASARSKPAAVPISQLSQRSQSARDRALHVLAAMRHDSNLSLTQAAKLQGVKVKTVKKYLPSALDKAKGRFHATKSDRYTATLYVPDGYGNPVAVKTHSSRDREAVGRYLRDLGRYLRGNRDALAGWHGKKIAGVPLVTAGRTILAIEPALSGFSPYRAVNSGAA
jgi:hypothetical protein